MNAVGAERFRAEHGGHRGVDPARDTDDYLCEAVLLDVVVEAEREREPHLLERGLERDDLRRCRCGRYCRRPELDGHDLGNGLPRPVELASSYVAQSAAHRVRRLEVDDEQVLLEARRAGEHFSGVVEDDRVPVEDELVLSADEVAEGDVRGRVTCARDEHLLALLGLADVKRRGRRLTMSCAPASARSVAGGPGCQMSSQIVNPRLVSPMRRSTRPRPSAK